MISNIALSAISYQIYNQILCFIWYAWNPFCPFTFFRNRGSQMTQLVKWVLIWLEWPPFEPWFSQNLISFGSGRIPSQMTHCLITPSRFIETLKQKYIKPKFGIVSHSRLLLLLAFRSCIWFRIGWKQDYQYILVWGEIVMLVITTALFVETELRMKLKQGFWTIAIFTLMADVVFMTATVLSSKTRGFAIIVTGQSQWAEHFAFGNVFGNLLPEMSL